MRSDQEIQRDVLEELQGDATSAPVDVSVSARCGIVCLAGAASTYAEKLAAHAAAERVAGVRGIIDDVVVIAPPDLQRDDYEILRDAREAMRLDVRVPAHRVRVSVARGWLTLEGVVRRPSERCAAEAAVQVLAGVRGISNQIAVEPQDITSPDAVTTIERALYRSAELDSKHIVVETTTDGDVFLRGTVRSWAEWHDAERAAWSAPGVRAVVNRLVVSL